MVAEGPLPELRTLPCYNEPLKKARPFLMPADDDQVVEILPAEKENRKINFSENILVTEIEDRFFFHDGEMEEEEEEAYEIEIVEDDGDADFYLEIVDGEVFYVFETEDDMSEDSMEELLDNDEASQTSSFESSMHSGTSDLGFDLKDLKTPDLDGGDASDQPEVLPGEITLSEQPPNAEDEGDGAGNDFELEFEDEDEQALEIPQSAKQDLDHRAAKKDERQTAKIAAKQKPGDALPSFSSSSSSSSSSDTSMSLSTEEKRPLPPKKASGVEPSQPAPPKKSQPVDVPMPNVSEPVTPPQSPGRGGLSTNSSLAEGNVSPSTPSQSILKSSVAGPRKQENKKNTCNKQQSKRNGAKPTVTKTYVRAEQFDGEHRVYSWQKPSWAQGDEPLASTPQGEMVRQGGNLAGPITHIRAKDDDPSCHDSPVSPTKGGEVTKEEVLRRFVSGEIGNGLITSSLYGKHRRLKLSVNGAKLREGADIVKPITKATVYRTPQNINHVANPGILKSTPKQQKKKYEWEKPEWARPKLKSTKQGEAVKQGADLQMPITQRVIDDAKAATAANRKLRHGQEIPPSKLDNSSHSGGGNGPTDSEAPKLRKANDPDREKRQRQQMLERVAKSWD